MILHPVISLPSQLMHALHLWFLSIKPHQYIYTHSFMQNTFIIPLWKSCAQNCSKYTTGIATIRDEGEVPQGGISSGPAVHYVHSSKENSQCKCFSMLTLQFMHQLLNEVLMMIKFDVQKVSNLPQCLSALVSSLYLDCLISFNNFELY